MRPPGNARLERNPAGVAPHQFDYHYAVMGFGRGVQLVDGVGGGVHGRVKAECNFSRRQIVVNGFGHADDFHALMEEFQRNLLRAVAADGDDSVNAQLAGVGNYLVGNIASDFLTILHGSVLERIAAVGGTEDGAATGEDAADILKRELT